MRVTAGRRDRRVRRGDSSASRGRWRCAISWTGAGWGDAIAAHLAGDASARSYETVTLPDKRRAC